MKTITIEIPDDADEEGARLAAQMTASNECICLWWHIGDVRERAADGGITLTDDECRIVLRRVKRYHDAECGVNWGVIDSWIDQYQNGKEKTK